MNIKDYIMSAIAKLQGDGGFGLNPEQGTSKFGEMNPTMPQQGGAGFNQLNAMKTLVDNPINAESSLAALKDATKEKAQGDYKKQILINSMAQMGGNKMPAQQPLQMIRAQQPYAPMTDATQPQQIQEFKPEQMAMMLRRRNGY